MTEREEMEELREWMREPDGEEDWCLSQTIDWLNRRPIAFVERLAALHSAARTGPDVAGFEACREAAEIVKRLRDQSDPRPVMSIRRKAAASIEAKLKRVQELEETTARALARMVDAQISLNSYKKAAAIAALPAPAGESVTVEKLCEFLWSNECDLYEDMARALLSTFTITRKSESRS